MSRFHRSRCVVFSHHMTRAPITMSMHEDERTKMILHATALSLLSFAVSFCAQLLLVATKLRLSTVLPGRHDIFTVAESSWIRIPLKARSLPHHFVPLHPPVICCADPPALLRPIPFARLPHSPRPTPGAQEVTHGYPSGVQRDPRATAAVATPLTDFPVDGVGRTDAGSSFHPSPHRSVPPHADNRKPRCLHTKPQTDLNHTDDCCD